jgi:chromate transporter
MDGFSLLTGQATLGAAAFGPLFVHFAMLSLLAIGGAITTVPEMHRYVVDQQGWLSEAQFSACIALGQATPGPNVLFVAVIGFQVGGLAGVLATMAGTLAPSAVLAVVAARWGQRHRQARAVRAFTAGLAPLTIGLLLATSAVLLVPVATLPPVAAGSSALLAALTLACMLRTRLSPLWPVAAGAVAGALGWV